MKILGYEIRRQSAISEQPAAIRELSEEEINAALLLPSDHPLWRALLQLLETAIDNAHELAAAEIPNTNRLAGYTGGAQHLRMFKEELIRRRGSGIAASRPAMRKPVAAAMSLVLAGALLLSCQSTPSPPGPPKTPATAAAKKKPPKPTPTPRPTATPTPTPTPRPTVTPTPTPTPTPSATPASKTYTLGWDPPNDPRITGYHLLSGSGSRAYTKTTDVGNVLAYKVTVTTDTYFAVTAYIADGQESVPSNEIKCPPLLSLSEE